jgi:hypothetical protein
VLLWFVDELLRVVGSRKGDEMESIDVRREVFTKSAYH